MRTAALRQPLVGDQTPITIAEACAGRYSVDFLLRECREGRLNAFRTGGRIFTTQASIREFEAVTDPKGWQASRLNEAGIYIVGFGCYLKIGWSDVIGERIADLQQGVPETLNLYGIIEPRPRLEFIAHRRFAEYRLRGEWFRNEGEIKRWAIGWRRLEIKPGAEPE